MFYTPMAFSGRNSISMFSLTLLFFFCSISKLNREKTIKFPQKQFKCSQGISPGVALYCHSHSPAWFSNSSTQSCDSAIQSVYWMPQLIKQITGQQAHKCLESRTAPQELFYKFLRLICQFPMMNSAILYLNTVYCFK